VPEVHHDRENTAGIIVKRLFRVGIRLIAGPRLTERSAYCSTRGSGELQLCKC
jgi:hypothetical protein